MISKDTYSIEYVNTLREKYRKDPSLLERVLFAFGLLEAITRVGMPFIFKGGTSLMLILDHPLRLSTDIDILCTPGTDVDRYIHDASKLFPFKAFEEDHRIGKNNIEKRHFKFVYNSPLRNDDFYILLDIVFAESPYISTETREIRNELLLTEGAPVTVTVPSPECILGDKLTAFAPHTTGVPLGADKELEIIKQLFDVASLAAEQASRVMYLASCMLTGQTFAPIVDPQAFLQANIGKSKYKKLSYMRRQSAEAFAYIVEAIRLIGK